MLARAPFNHTTHNHSVDRCNEYARSQSHYVKAHTRKHNNYVSPVFIRGSLFNYITQPLRGLAKAMRKITDLHYVDPMFIRNSRFVHKIHIHCVSRHNHCANYRNHYQIAKSRYHNNHMDPMFIRGSPWSHKIQQVWTDITTVRAPKNTRIIAHEIRQRLVRETIFNKCRNLGSPQFSVTYLTIVWSVYTNL